MGTDFQYRADREDDHVKRAQLPSSVDTLVAAFVASSGRERERHGEALLQKYDKVIEAILRDDAAKAGVHVARVEEQIDVRNELRICLFEAAVSYDPVRGGGDGTGFEHWVRYCIQNRLSSLAGAETIVEMPESWQRVGRIAARVDEVLTAKHGRAPSFEQLRAGVLVHCQAWAQERIYEQACNGVVEETELGKLVEEKLRKQGTLGAIENLASILQLRGVVASIDVEGEPEADEHRSSLYDSVFAVLSSTERSIVERRMGMHDGREWSFEEIAAELGLEWTEVRRRLAVALVKPKAPHAQYVYLSGISAQLDDERNTVDPVDRLRARMSSVRN
jgi:DNA-directed RNA polymerase sigma subunit (sigma70/sigma32)